MVSDLNRWANLQQAEQNEVLLRGRYMAAKAELNEARAAVEMDASGRYQDFKPVTPMATSADEIAEEVDVMQRFALRVAAATIGFSARPLTLRGLWSDLRYAIRLRRRYGLNVGRSLFHRPERQQVKTHDRLERALAAVIDQGDWSRAQKIVGADFDGAIAKDIKQWVMRRSRTDQA